MSETQAISASSGGVKSKCAEKSRVSIRAAQMWLKARCASDWVRGFVLLAGGILLFAALAKLANFPWKPTMVQTPFDLKNPIFGVSVKSVMLTGIALQLAAALLCLFTKRTSGALIFIAWLAANFFVYRIGLWTSGWHHPVFALYYLCNSFDLSPRMADAITVGAAFYLFVGSLAALWILRRSRIAAGFLKASCPSCGGHVKFPIQNLGQQISCPHCKAAMVLQSLGETMKMTCVLCGGHVEFPAHAAGQKIPCPHCAKTITLLKPA